MKTPPAAAFRTILPDTMILKQLNNSNKHF